MQLHNLGFIGRIAVCASILFVSSEGTEACHPSPAVLNTVQTVLTDVQEACVWINAALPIVQIQTACDVANISETVIQQIVNDFLAQRKVVDAYAMLVMKQRDAARAHIIWIDAGK